MSVPEHPILIGCSGWSYPDWEGPFYPAGMAAGDYLEWYADRFPIVEVDSTFYRPPTPRMVRGWRDRTPDGFKFALKVPQAITHQKQLRDCAEEVDGFVSSIEPLGSKLYCALLQRVRSRLCHGLRGFSALFLAGTSLSPHLERLPRL